MPESAATVRRPIMEGINVRRLALASSLLAVLLPAAVAATASAANPQVSPQAAERALDAALDALSPPIAASSGPAAGSRDATVALRDLAVSLPALRGADRRRARALLARPTDKNDRAYFGKEAKDSPVCNAHFCLHWTEKAKNRPNRKVFKAIFPAMNQSRAIENEDLGWRDPKSDGKLGARHGKGRDGQVDVYVTNLGRRLYGYASPDGHQRGQKRYAYLVLDNDYVGFPTGPVQSMQVTAAHEYNHILQFNYDVFEDVWLFEDTATWMEEQVYPNINDYLNYLPAFAKTSSRPMTGSSIKIYAEAVWNHWLGNRFGDEVVRHTWEVSPKQRSFAVAAYNKAIKGAGGPGFAPELGDFFAATAEWRSLPGRFTDDYAEFPDMKRSGKIDAGTAKTKLDNTSYRLYDVDPTGGAAISLDVKAEKGTKSSISLIGREGGTGGAVTISTGYLGKGGTGEVTLADPGKFSRITAMVANVDGDSKRRRKGKRVYTSDNSSYRFSLGAG
jgi:uncharacterized protein DUF6055